MVSQILPDGCVRVSWRAALQLISYRLQTRVLLTGVASFGLLVGCACSMHLQSACRMHAHVGIAGSPETLPVLPAVLLEGAKQAGKCSEQAANLTCLMLLSIAQSESSC